jgi:hypothetical protein
MSGFAVPPSSPTTSSTSSSTAVEVKTQQEDEDNTPSPPLPTQHDFDTLGDFDVGSLGSTTAPPLTTDLDNVQFRSSLTRGSVVDCQDGDSMWYESVVEDFTSENVTVRFLGWSRKWNALLHRDSPRIATRNTKVPNWRQTLTPGKCVEVSTSDSCTWCTAVVSVVQPTRFQVIRAPACTTEWHDINSLLIAEPYTHCGYKIEADARERRRMLAARRNLFNIELQMCYNMRAMSSRMKVAENLGEHLLGISPHKSSGGGSNNNNDNNNDNNNNNNDNNDDDDDDDNRRRGTSRTRNATTGEGEMKEGSSNNLGSNGGRANHNAPTATEAILATKTTTQQEDNAASVMYQSGEPTPFSDVVFVVEGEKIHAHRVLMVARSPYFRRMFLGGLREATETNTSEISEISLPDTTAATFRSVVKYMYTGVCSINHNNALELLHAAHLFCLDGLAKAIEIFLFRAVSTETAMEIIVAANTFSLVDLEAHCVEYIIDHYETFVPHLTKLASHPQILITIMESMRKPKKRKSNKGLGLKETIATSDGGGNGGGSGSASKSPEVEVDGGPLFP